MSSIDPPRLPDRLGPTHVEGATAPRFQDQVLIRNIFASLSILLGTLVLRMTVIGHPPWNDEGFYAFNAQLIANGAKTYPLAPINFYAPLVGRVGMPLETPFLYLRAVDGLVAACAAVMLYFFLSRWTEWWIAFLMASGWSIASNLPILAEAGFRNSIMAATLVYLGGLGMLSRRSGWSPFWSGLLIPLSVFLREAFFPIVIVSLCLAAMMHGRRGLIVHVAGLATSGSALLIWLSIYRGHPLEILGYFRVELPAYYAALTQDRDVYAERWLGLRQTAKMTIWLMPPALLGVVWLLVPERDRRAAKKLAILLFLPPLYEIFSKVCYAYHWAQLLLGVVFLGAMGLQWLVTVGRSSERRWLKIVGFAGLAWLSGELDARSVYYKYRDAYRRTRVRSDHDPGTLGSFLDRAEPLPGIGGLCPAEDEARGSHLGVGVPSCCLPAVRPLAALGVGVGPGLDVGDAVSDPPARCHRAATPIPASSRHR